MTNTHMYLYTGRIIGRGGGNGFKGRRWQAANANKTVFFYSSIGGGYPPTRREKEIISRIIRTTRSNFFPPAFPLFSSAFRFVWWPFFSNCCRFSSGFRRGWRMEDGGFFGWRMEEGGRWAGDGVSPFWDGQKALTVRGRLENPAETMANSTQMHLTVALSRQRRRPRHWAKM